MGKRKNVLTFLTRVRTNSALIYDARRILFFGKHPGIKENPGPCVQRKYRVRGSHDGERCLSVVRRLEGCVLNVSVVIIVRSQPHIHEACDGGLCTCFVRLSRICLSPLSSIVVDA